jgi:hypothetical protein
MRDALMRWPPMRDTSMEGLLKKPVSLIVFLPAVASSKEDL